MVSVYRLSEDRDIEVRTILYMAYLYFFRHCQNH